MYVDKLRKYSPEYDKNRKDGKKRVTISSNSKCGDATRLKNRPVTVSLPTIKGLRSDGEAEI